MVEKNSSCCYLTQADANVALKVAERCQRMVRKQAITHAQSPLGEHITVSIGVGTIIPGEGLAPADFVEAVDQQLYVAKKNGRNRMDIPGN